MRALLLGNGGLLHRKREAPSDIRRTTLRQDVKPWLGARSHVAGSRTGMTRSMFKQRAIAALRGRVHQVEGGGKCGRVARPTPIASR